MSSILYYSKYCEICKNYLQILSKMNIQKDVHFICIDKREKDANNKTYIILDNGQKIILPENITKVPALLLLNQGYKVIYGDQILTHLKPIQKEEIRHATQNNMEPMAFSLGGSGNFGSIMSDQYSFLDQNPDELTATGNGGMRQMHNYVDINTAFNGKLSDVGNNEENPTIRGSTKMSEDTANQQMEERMKKMQEQRDADMKSIAGNRPPMAF